MSAHEPLPWRLHAYSWGRVELITRRETSDEDGDWPGFERHDIARCARWTDGWSNPPLWVSLALSLFDDALNHLRKENAELLVPKRGRYAVTVAMRNTTHSLRTPLGDPQLPIRPRPVKAHALCLRLDQADRLARVACAIARNVPGSTRYNAARDAALRTRWLPYLLAAVANCVPGAPMESIACECRAEGPYFVDQLCQRRIVQSGQRSSYVRQRRLDADPRCERCKGSGFKLRPPRSMRFLLNVLD